MSISNNNNNTPSSNETKNNECISTKLKFRLSQLTAAASKETVQTLSNWILFHSKTHPEALRQVLLSQFLLSHDDEDKLQPMDPNMYFVYLKIIHEICIRDSEQDVLPNEQRFASSLPFRVSLAEHVIQPVLQAMAREGLLIFQKMGFVSSSSATSSTSNDIDTIRSSTTINHQDIFSTLMKTLQEYIHVWRDLDCFDSISLMDEIQRIMDKINLMNRTEDAVAAKDEPMMDASQESSKEEKDAQIHTVNTTISEHEEEPKDVDSTLDETVMDVSNHDQMTDEQEEQAKADEQEEQAKADEQEDANEETMKSETVESPMETKDDKATVPSTTTAKDTITEYDFEAENIPSKEILPQQLVESAKAIATMQITRDLQNDNSHTLSTILNKVPMNVFQRCKELLLLQEQANDKSSLSKENIISMIPDDVLDLDISTSLNNVRLHRDIILKQKQLRQDCTTLLIQSRCNFGSHDAAAAYYTSIDDLIKRVESVQDRISDAAELEGLDFEDNVTEEQEEVNKLKDFDWFSKSDVEEYLARKKQKIA
jgi:hypothetical protein